MNSIKPYTFDRVVRILIGLGILILIFILLKRLSGVLLPFFIAWLIAYLLHPIVTFFQNKLKFKNRIISIVFTLLTVASISVGIVLLLIPIVSTEIQKIIQIINLYTQGITIDSIIPISWQIEIRNYLSKLDIQTILNDENIMLLIKKITPQIWAIFNGSLTFLLSISIGIIVILYIFFILIDYERINKGMIEIIPHDYRNLITEIISDIEIGMNRYFRGQALVAFIVGILFAIGFNIIGLPLAVVFGLFVGVLNLVPYLQTLAVIPALLLGFLQSVETGQSYGHVLLLLLIVFIIVQSFQDLVLVPTILGKATGLNPAIILLSLSIWGSLMGMIGLIIALPLTTLIISYYNRFVIKKEDILKNNDNDAATEDNIGVNIQIKIQLVSGYSTNLISRIIN